MRDTDHRFAFPAVLVGSCALAFGPWLVRLSGTGPVAAGFWRLALALLVTRRLRDHRSCAFEDVVRLFPGRRFGRRDDRPEGDLDPRQVGAPGGAGGGPHRLDLLGGLRQRLAPEAVDVRLGPAGRSPR